MNNLTTVMKINAIDNDFSLTDDQWNSNNILITKTKFRDPSIACVYG
jgi:hypothetical protein